MSNLNFQYSGVEDLVESRSPSPQLISSATTLSISNDSNSEDNDSNVVTESLSHNYINLEDQELDENTETEVEEDVSIGIIEEPIEWSEEM